MQFDRLKRREFITLLGGMARRGRLGRAHNDHENCPFVGVLVSASPPHPFADAFWRGLTPSATRMVQNIKVEFRYTDARSDRAEEYAEELVRLSLDVIVAHYALAVSAAMAATRTIPIVMAPHGAPLQLGAIAAWLGLAEMSRVYQDMDAEIGGKRVELLRELIPNLRCIAVLATTLTTTRFSGPFVEDLRLAATTAGLRFEPILIGGPSEFRSAFATMAKTEAQAVIVMPFLRSALGDPCRTRGQAPAGVHVGQPGCHGGRGLGLHGCQLSGALRAGRVLRRQNPQGR